MQISSKLSHNNVRITKWAFCAQNIGVGTIKIVDKRKGMNKVDGLIKSGTRGVIDT